VILLVIIYTALFIYAKRICKLSCVVFIASSITSVLSYSSSSKRNEMEREHIIIKYNVSNNSSAEKTWKISPSLLITSYLHTAPKYRIKMQQCDNNNNIINLRKVVLFPRKLITLLGTEVGKTIQSSNIRMMMWLLCSVHNNEVAKIGSEKNAVMLLATKIIGQHFCGSTKDLKF